MTAVYLFAGLAVLSVIAGIIVAVVLANPTDPVDPPPPPPVKLKPPEVAPGDGTFTKSITISLTNLNDTGEMSWSFSGNRGGTTSDRMQILLIEASTRLAAWCHGDGKPDSATVVLDYVIEPEDPEEPEPLPPGEYNLATQVVNWISRLVPESEWSKATALSGSFKTAYDDVQANPTMWTIGLVQNAIKVRNDAIIGDDGEKWEAFGVQFAATLDDLEKEQQQIRNVRDYAQACLEISWGLAATDHFQRETRQ